MNKRKFLLVAIIPLLLSYHAQSQIVKWCIHPEYDEITYFGDDLFKCVSRTGKVQLYDRDGEKLLHNVDADSITDFAEGYAVALNGKKILGFLTQTGGHGFYPVSGEYMITKYPFFSEGLLVVADGKGKMGYMNVQGDLAIPCKYLEARPFKQGWASVDMAKKKVYYINFQGKTGNPVALPLRPVVGNAIYDYITKERPQSDSPYIFLHSQKGTKLSSTFFSKMSYKFFDAAGIRMNGENRGMHMFRHYVATSLINEGHDTPIVMSVLGHTVPLAVDYYLESDYMQLKECGIDISRWPIRKEVLL